MSTKRNQNTISTQTGGRTKKEKKRKNGNTRGSGTTSRPAPVAIGYQHRGGQPKIRGGADNAVVIHHSELVFDTPLYDVDLTSFPDSLFRFSVNPGLGQTFPWLANIASNFGFYRFRNLRFEFISSAPTSLGGEVELAFDPDASNSAPATKSALLNFRASARGPPYQKLALAIPQSLSSAQSRNGRRPVRSGGQNVTQEMKPLYDAGSFYFRSVGPTALGAVGEVWVHYDVELFNPQSVDNLAVAISVAATNVSVGHFLGDQTSHFGGLSIGIGDSATTTFVYLAAGRYYCLFRWTGPNIGTGSPFIAATAGSHTEATEYTESISVNTVSLVYNILVSQGDTGSNPSGFALSLTSGSFGAGVVTVEYTIVHYSV